MKFQIKQKAQKQRIYTVSELFALVTRTGIENLGALLRLVKMCRKARKYVILEQYAKFRLRCFLLSLCTLSGQIADKKHSTYPCTYSFLTDVQIISADKMNQF